MSRLTQAAAALELTLSYDIEYVCTSKGYPEQGPTYSCGGTPAEPPEFDIKVMFNGVDIYNQLTESQQEEVYDHVRDDWESE